MCGRFTLRPDPRQFADWFGLDELPLFEPRYNIPPTTTVAVVRDHALGEMRWGLVPAWAKDLKIGASLINARAETVAEKPAFRAAFKRRRCLVPADGYFEWQKRPAGKQPYWIHLDGAPLFAFAGLWECWTKAEPALESCTIITTEANDATRPVHDRMPVILDRRDYARWLDPSTDPAELAELLRPYDGDDLVCTPVSTYVNNVRNQGPECIAPA